MISSSEPHPTTPPVPASEWLELLLAVHASEDSEELIQAVFRLLRETVDCDFSLVVLHAVDHLPMVARDSLGRVYSYEFMERSYQHNPATAYLMANPGVRMLSTREQLLAGDAMLEHPFYEHGMKPMNFRHCLALFFWDYLPQVAHQVFAVMRSEGRADFTQAEETAILGLHPHIDTALKRIRRHQNDLTTRQGLASLAEALPSGHIVLDWELNITQENATSRKLLIQWNKATSSSLIPKEFLGICASLKEQWRNMLKLDPKGQLVCRESLMHPTKSGLRAEISIHCPPDASLAHPSFVIHIEATPTTHEEILKRLLKLTTAEREVTLLAGKCLDNQHIADRLSLTVSAVKTRLHTAFKKLQVTHRSQIVALLQPLEMREGKQVPPSC